MVLPTSSEGCPTARWLTPIKIAIRLRKRMSPTPLPARPRSRRSRTSRCFRFCRIGGRRRDAAGHSDRCCRVLALIEHGGSMHCEHANDDDDDLLYSGGDRERGRHLDGRVRASRSFRRTRPGRRPRAAASSACCSTIPFVAGASPICDGLMALVGAFVDRRRSAGKP